jgi:hypothetical protein
MSKYIIPLSFGYKVGYSLDVCKATNGAHVGPAQV